MEAWVLGRDFEWLFGLPREASSSSTSRSFELKMQSRGNSDHTTDMDKKTIHRREYQRNKIKTIK